jgi:hypothetical protein
MLNNDQAAANGEGCGEAGVGVSPVAALAFISRDLSAPAQLTPFFPVKHPF